MKNLFLLLALFCTVFVTAADEDGCNEDEFRCTDDSTCVPGNWRCDGDNDCNDGEDETGCEQAAGSCDPGYFDCGDGECIPYSWRCDGEAECTNRADERNCQDNSNRK